MTDHLETMDNLEMSYALLSITAPDPYIPGIGAKLGPAFDLLEETTNNGWDAARHGHSDIVHLLLSRGADPDGRRGVTTDDDEHAYPLHYAVQHGHEEVVSLLLEYGANVYLRHDEFAAEDNVLIHAVRYPAIFKRLMKNKSIMDAFSEDILEFVAEEAIYAGQASEVQLLIDYGLDFSSGGFTRTHDYSQGLFQLLGQSNESILEIFSQNGYIPQPSSEAEQHAVRAAVRRGGIPLIQLLVRRGFNLCSQRWWFFFIFGIYQALETRGATLDFFLQQGIPIDSLNSAGETLLLALALSQAFNSDGYLRILLGRSADPCFQSPVGDCPLVAAVTMYYTTIELVKGLLFAIMKQGIPYEIFEPQVKKAINILEKNGKHFDILKMLRRFYWRAKYPV